MAKGAKEGGSQNIGSKEGGYKDLRDRFDGGGPGRSGDRFEGGGIFSAIGNALGGPGAIGFGPRDGGGDGATMSTRSSDGILGNVLDPRMTPGRVAGGMLGSLALGPIGGIIGSLIGQQMMQQAQAERAAREQAAEQNQPLMNPVKFADGGPIGRDFGDILSFIRGAATGPGVPAEVQKMAASVNDAFSSIAAERDALRAAGEAANRSGYQYGPGRIQSGLDAYYAAGGRQGREAMENYTPPNVAMSRFVESVSQGNPDPSFLPMAGNRMQMNTVQFANGGDVRPGFFGMLAGLGNEDQSGLFGGLGSLGRLFFGDDETGPDMDQVEALREALEAGEISQDTYETMYARLLLDESSRDPAMGLLNLSNYVLKAGEPQAPNQLSTTISRGSGGSGARALGRLGAQPLV